MALIGSSASSRGFGLVVAICLLAVACGSTPQSTPAGSLSGPAVSAPPSASAEPVATSTVVVTASPSAQPTATAAAAPTATPTADQPPAGLLAAGGEPITGHLGTFCWAGLCADEFKLPDASSLPLLELGGGADVLSLSLARDAGFTGWSASYTSAGMADLLPLASGGADYDPDSTASTPPDLTEATFAPPPPGDWTLVVSLRFSTGDDASYAWHVSVP